MQVIQLKDIMQAFFPPLVLSILEMVSKTNVKQWLKVYNIYHIIAFYCSNKTHWVCAVFFLPYSLLKEKQQFQGT